MIKNRTSKSTIIYLMWICLIAPSVVAAESNLLFKSGFEGAIQVVPWSPMYNNNRHAIEGIDGDHIWPNDIPGDADYHHFVYVVGDDKDYSDYVQTEITTVSGRHGQSTRALYQAVNKDDPDDNVLTRNQFNIYPSPSNNLDQLYVRYWIKFQSNLDTIMSPSSWRMMAEWYESDEDYSFNLMVKKPAGGGELIWALNGRILKPEIENDFLEYNDQIPVPVGEWFLLELFWKHSTGPDGQIIVKVNEEEVFNRRGRNKLDSELLAFAVFKCYGRTDYYQWIDDFEIWDSLPELGPPQPPKNIEFFVIKK